MEDKIQLWHLLVFMALFFTLAFCVDIYRSSCQAEFYQKQGVQVTTWEIMMGVKPIIVAQPPK